MLLLLLLPCNKILEKKIKFKLRLNSPTRLSRCVRLAIHPWTAARPGRSPRRRTVRRRQCARATIARAFFCVFDRLSVCLVVVVFFFVSYRIYLFVCRFNMPVRTRPHSGCSPAPAVRAINSYPTMPTQLRTLPVRSCAITPCCLTQIIFTHTRTELLLLSILFSKRVLVRAWFVCCQTLRTLQSSVPFGSTGKKKPFAWMFL